jgi:hypothetical protein
VIGGTKEQESIQRQSEGGGGGREELAVAVAPGDPSEPGGGDGQEDRQEKRVRGVGEEFVNRAAEETAAGEQAIDGRQPGLKELAAAQGRGLVLVRARGKDLERTAGG